MQKVERFIIMERSSGFDAMRMVATEDMIKEQAGILEETGRYERVIIAQAI